MSNLAEAQARAMKQREELQRPIVNTSGITPFGHAVLVKPYTLKPANASRLVIPDTVKDRSRMLENRAIVIAIGSEAWRDEKQPRAKVGDHVLIAQLAGTLHTGPDDDILYRMVNANDIYAGISPPKPEEAQQ